MKADKPATTTSAPETRTHAKLEFARLERQELADIRKQRDEARAHADKLAEALQLCVSFLADLNGQPSITGSHVTAQNMRNLSKARQQNGYAALAAYEESR